MLLLTVCLHGSDLIRSWSWCNAKASARASGDIIKKRAVSSPDIAQELGFGPIQIQTAFSKSLNIAINLSTSLTSTWNLGSTWIIVMKVYVAGGSGGSLFVLRAAVGFSI